MRSFQVGSDLTCVLGVRLSGKIWPALHRLQFVLFSPFSLLSPTCPSSQWLPLNLLQRCAAKWPKPPLIWWCLKLHCAPLWLLPLHILSIPFFSWRQLCQDYATSKWNWVGVFVFVFVFVFVVMTGAVIYWSRTDYQISCGSNQHCTSYNTH